MKKKRKANPVAAALKVAAAKGLEFKSTGVRLAGMSGTSTGVNPAAAGTVNWQRLPEGFLEGASESEWQSLVRSFAEAHGWACYHTLDSQGSDPGVPDLTMFRENVNTGDVWLYYAELKDMTGKESKEQKEFARLVTALGMNHGSKYQKPGPRVRSYLWKPDQWEMVQRILSEPME